MASTDALPLARKNVAYRLYFAIYKNDGTLITGASGLDSEISKDGAAFADVTAEATEIGSSGTYFLDLTNTEMNADNVMVVVKTSSTGAVIPTFSINPQESGDIKVDVQSLLGTAWLTPGTAGTPDVNVKLWNALATVELPLVPTTAGRKLDVSAGGEAGVDWANVGSPTTTLALTGTTIATTQKVDVETIKTNPVVNAGTVTFPTTATLASTTNITAGTVTTATNLTNAPTAGDFTATMKTSIGTAVAASAVASVTGNVGGSVASVTAAVRANVTRSATAQAGAGTTITLDASASATDDLYNNQIVFLRSGTGAGQARFITDYVGATKVATVATWQTNPDNTSVFDIFPFDAIAGASAPTAAQIRTEMDTNSTQLAKLGTPAGASISADIAAVKVDTAAILVDTGTTLDGRIPAALVGGRMDASVGAMAANVMTAAAAAADLTTELQSGLATASAVSTLQTSVDDLPTNAELTTALGTADDAVLARLGTPAGASVSADIAAAKVDTAAIKAKTDSLTFTTAGMVDSAIKRVGNTTLNAAGTGGQGYGA